MFVHCFMDGRDTPPESGAGYIEQMQKADAADRRRQDRDRLGPLLRHGSRQALGRVERAFGAMVLGNGEKSDDPVAAVKRSYERGVTDEFIEPVTIVDAHKQPVGLIRDDDACIFFNYRADRGREMTMALTDPTLENRRARRRRRICTSPP